MAVQVKSGVIIPLNHSRHRVAIQVLEAVVYRPQLRVVVDQQVLQHRLLLNVHTVVGITQENAEN